jgi:hypothetical protein
MIPYDLASAIASSGSRKLKLFRETMSCRDILPRGIIDGRVMSVMTVPE